MQYSSHFQPGEGPSRGLLCDCETSHFAKVGTQLYPLPNARTNACCTQATLSGEEEVVPDSAQGEARMWYPSMSVFSHSCCPNTEALCRTNYGLALSATKVVDKENVHSSDLH